MACSFELVNTGKGEKRTDRSEKNLVVGKKVEKKIEFMTHESKRGNSRNH